MTVYTTMSSPVGELLLAGELTDEGLALASVSMPGQARPVTVRPDWRPDLDAFGELTAQFAAYFAGELDRFAVTAAPAGTPFQRRVWAAVDEIASGTTVSYGGLAALIGVPRNQVRAVGGAVGANPLLIVRPCHRVVGANGSLTGYAAGLERKRFLLSLEGAGQPQPV